MTESIRVSAHFGKPLPEHVKPSRPSRRFRILVLADFGSDNTWNSPVEVDRDDLDEVFQRMNVTVRLPEGGEAPALEIGIKQLEDFQPDQLFELVDWFSSLRTRRRRLQNDATFADEARSIMAADAAGGAASDAAGKPRMMPTCSAKRCSRPSKTADRPSNRLPMEHSTLMTMCAES